MLLLVFVVLCVRATLLIATDWVKLPALKPTGDSFNVHSEMLMDRYVDTTSRPPEAGFGMEIQPVVAPIKYEDLVHIVGPGFEDDLERYYEQHKHDVDESTRRTTRPQSGKPNRVFYVPEDDPWSMYDKPEAGHTHQDTPSNVSLHNYGGGHFSNYDSEYVGRPTEVSFVSKPLVSNKDTNKKHHLLVPAAVAVHRNMTHKPFPEDTDDNQNMSATTVKDTTTKTGSGSKKTTKRKVYKLVQVQAPSGSTSTASMFGISNILDFLRNIQNSFVTNTSRSIQDKIKMLESFRDDMLGNIKQRIAALWPLTTKVVRNKRGIHESHSGSGGHGMDFPSSEGALMTISFLTFAVFLIKLVLQVINTIKSKHYTYNSFDTYIPSASVGVGATIKENLNARSVRHVGEYPLDDDPIMAGGSQLNVEQIMRSLPKNHQFF